MPTWYGQLWACSILPGICPNRGTGCLSQFFLLQFTHFIRQFLEAKKQTPPIYPLLECMFESDDNQSDVQRSKEFHSGTGRDFCKIPGSRDFPGRDLRHIFIPGFFGNCSGFFGIFLFDTIGDQFKHFSRAGKPNKNFSIRKTDQLIIGEMICKDLHMPYRNF